MIKNAGMSRNVAVTDHKIGFTFNQLWDLIHLVFAFLKKAVARVLKMAEGPPSLINFCLLFELRYARWGPINSPFGRIFSKVKIV